MAKANSYLRKNLVEIGLLRHIFAVADRSELKKNQITSFTLHVIALELKLRGK